MRSALDNLFFEAVVVLSEYAGNYERQLTHWVFGAEAEYMPGGYDLPERPHAEEMEWAYGGEIEGILKMQTHEEYGSVWETIGDDSEWLEEKLAEDPKPKYGHAVTWHFDDDPTDEQWQAFKAALNSNPFNLQIEKMTLNAVYPRRTLLRRVP